MMNERIKELMEQASSNACYDELGQLHLMNKEIEKFAELIVQDCADHIRSTYDHENAENIAWNLEMRYNLHGDYAE